MKVSAMFRVVPRALYLVESPNPLSSSNLCEFDDDCKENVCLNRCQRLVNTTKIVTSIQTGTGISKVDPCV